MVGLWCSVVDQHGGLVHRGGVRRRGEFVLLSGKFVLELVLHSNSLVLKLSLFVVLCDKFVRWSRKFVFQHSGSALKPSLIVLQCNKFVVKFCCKIDKA